MPKRATPERRSIQAALELAAERGWAKLAMADVAEHAGLGLDQLSALYPTKTALLAGWARQVDEAMLAPGPADAADSARDRLFEILMRRFDALHASREGAVAILRDLQRQPATALALWPSLERSMRWALEAARLPVTGPLAGLRPRVLGLLYLDLLRVWIRDDSLDMARTMAALDRRLGQLEQLARMFDRGAPAKPAEPEKPGEAAP